MTDLAAKLAKWRAIATDAGKIAPGEWWQDEGHVHCGPYTHDPTKRSHVAFTHADPGKGAYNGGDIVRARHIVIAHPARILAMLDVIEAAARYETAYRSQTATAGDEVREKMFARLASLAKEATS